MSRAHELHSNLFISHDFQQHPKFIMIIFSIDFFLSFFQKKSSLTVSYITHNAIFIEKRLMQQHFSPLIIVVSCENL